jgi:Fe-S cluster assembly protein SufD
VQPLNEQTFDRATSALPGWARDLAGTGFEAFGSLEMPTSREEDWRYVEIAADLDSIGLPDGPGSQVAVAGAAESTIDTAGRAVNVDGFTVSVEGDGPAIFASLADAFAAHGDVLQEVYRKAGPPADLDRFSAAHHAFGSDGVVLVLPKGTVSPRPYLVEFQATTPGTLALPRLTVFAQDGSEGSAVVHLRSPDGVALVAVPQIEVLTGADARFALTLVQEWGDQTYAVAQQRMVSGRDAALHLSEMGLGGSNSRLHLTIDLEGRGSDARVLGLYFGDRNQTLDYRYFMNHRAPNTTSDMYLKGAVGDTARSVFTGMIRIDPEGQKTNAVQTNRNLVLSEGAQAHSVPNLEILANDVKCGHGSAVGPLDGEQRHYLMSRGLGREQADRLQVKGFFEDVLARFPRQELEPPLREAVMAKYAGVMNRGL